MQRYFLADDAMLEGGKFLVTGNDAHHMQRVMRMKPGDLVEVVVNGEVWLANIVELGADAVSLASQERLNKNAEAGLQLTLVQGLPKGEKIDLVIRQACEIGAARIHIFAASRSVATLSPDKKENRLARWRKMAKESAEQAHRAQIPEVAYFSSLPGVLEALDEETGLLVPYEAQDEPLPTIKQVLQDVRLANGKKEKLAIFIGPEGGFEPAEILQLQGAGGTLLTLGPRILRTETAGVVVASIVFYEFDQLGVTP